MTDPLPLDASRQVYRTCLSLPASRAARGLARRFDAAFHPFGLTSGQFSLLHALNRAEVATVGRLSALLAMDRTTVTANLKPLERRGLLVSRPDPKDARSRHLLLTDAGHALLRDVLPAWERIMADVEAMLADADRLRSDLRSLG